MGPDKGSECQIRQSKWCINTFDYCPEGSCLEKERLELYYLERWLWCKQNISLYKMLESVILSENTLYMKHNKSVWMAMCE